MIILHGFLGCLDNWQSVAKSISDQYQVFVPDLPNHGRSPHSNQFNFKILAEEISAFIRSHMDVPINAIGHSMGGKILLEIVNSQPEIFQKMVIADIGTKSYPPEQSAMMVDLLQMPISQFKSRSEAVDYLTNLGYNASFVLFLMKNLDRSDQQEFKWKANIPVLTENYFEILKSVEPSKPIHIPILFVRGSESHYITSGDQVQLEVQYQKALFHTIDHAGHWVHADQPDEFVRTVRDFFNSHN